MNLSLHKEKGMNPHLTFCSRCGGDTKELILLGELEGKYECRACGALHFGCLRDGICKNENCGGVVEKIGVVGDSERLPATDLCDRCKKELAEFKAEVEKGGIYWKCDTCRTSGVIKAGVALAVEIRKVHGIEAPGLCGVDFTDDTKGLCPVCSGTVEKVRASALPQT